MSGNKAVGRAPPELPVGAMTRDTQLLEKMTRWDRITKQHLHKVNVQTAQVKRLFGMNFVNERQQRNMNGDYSGAADGLDCSAGGGPGDEDGSGDGGRSRARSKLLDPALVMDMRHSMIRSTKAEADPAISSDQVLKQYHQERRRNHNIHVEERYLDHELKKFKHAIKSTVKPTISMVVKLDNYMPTPQPSSNVNPEDAVEEANENSDTTKTEEETCTSFRNAEHEYFENEVNFIDPFEAELPAERNTTTITFKNYVEVHNYEPDTAVYRPSESFDSGDVNDDDEADFMPATARSSEPLHLFGTTLNSFVGDGPPVIVRQQAPQPALSTAAIDITEKPIITITKMDLESRPMTTSTAANQKWPDADTAPVSPLPPERSQIIADLHAMPQQPQTMSEADRNVLHLYFRRWTHHVTMERMAAMNGSRLAGVGNSRGESRAHKIEEYLRAIRHEKKTKVSATVGDQGAAGCETDKSAAAASGEKTRRTEMSGFAAGVMVKKFSNKLKVQRDIIELQRLKLERQERMIAELKFTRLAESTRESQATCKQELRDVIRTGCTRSKATARCLQLVGNLRDPAEDAGVAEEYARLQARGTPKFLQDMQARAMERNARHREARERREQLDREKEEQRLAAEAAKLLQDEQAKQQRIEELREKRRAERLQREQREQDRLRYMDNVHKANAFNRRRLLRRFGMDAFQALVRIKRRNLQKADMFRVFSSLRRSFGGWRRHVLAVWAVKQRRADECARSQAIRNAFAVWMKYQSLQHSKLLVAIDWHDMRLAERTLRHWDGWTRHQKCVEAVRMRQAEAHYEWHLKWRVLDHWQRLRQMLQLEKETDERRQRWRVKIWELLPDYRPNASAAEDE